MNVNQTAFCTSTLAAIGTTACVIAAVTTTAGTVALVAYSILAVGFGAAGIGSMTAWLDDSSLNTKSYFDNLKKHVAYATVGMTQFIAQGLLMSLFERLFTSVSGSNTTTVHHRVHYGSNKGNFNPFSPIQ